VILEANFWVCWVDVIFVQRVWASFQKVVAFAFAELGFSRIVQELQGIAENCAELCKIATACAAASGTDFWVVTIHVVFVRVPVKGVLGVFEAVLGEPGFLRIVHGLSRIVWNCAAAWVAGFGAIFLFVDRFSLLNKTCRSCFRLTWLLFWLNGAFC
jgi:hypothetical protein